MKHGPDAVQGSGQCFPVQQIGLDMLGVPSAGVEGKETEIELVRQEW
jgi:hypothetical protein